MTEHARPANEGWNVYTRLSKFPPNCSRRATGQLPAALRSHGPETRGAAWSPTLAIYSLGPQ